MNQELNPELGQEHADESKILAGGIPDGESEMDQFDEFMAGYLESMSGFEVGQLAKATVVEIGKEQVLLDIGDKAEGVCARKEFQDFKDNLLVHAGEEVEVVVEGRDSETGLVNVSYRKARQRVEWARIVAAFEKGETVHGQVTRALKNGLLVDVGIPCFLPASQIGLGRIASLESLVDQSVECYIIDIDRQRHRGVLSRRRLLTEQKAEQRAKELAALEEGQTVEGRVKSVVEFGVFVELGSLDGLVPRDEIAWEKRIAPSEALKPDAKHKFLVVAVDKDKGRITLSRKRLSPDPWLSIKENHPIDSRLTGKVTNLTNNCAYLVLPDGIEGRVHRDHLSWLPNIKKPNDLLKKNQEVEAQVLSYDNDKRLLELGLKQLGEDPWSDIDSRFPPKSRHTVTISDVVNFGAFAKVDEHTKGLIHLTDMTWDRTIKDPRLLVKKGDKVEVSVVKIDHKNRRLNFGMKQLQEDPFTKYARENPQGTVVTGTVKNTSSFGVFIELAPVVEGLLHISQWATEKTDNLESVAKAGDEVTAKIIKIEKKDRKISLSRRAWIQDDERQVLEQYKQQDSGKTSTNLGSLLQGLDIKVGV